MCRSCGAIVGAGAVECGVCGASTNPQQAEVRKQPMPDRETIRFARAVLDRPYKFTIALLVANVFLFLLMWDSSGRTWQVLAEHFSTAVLQVYGAKLNYLINAPYHQYWRFVTPMFVHVNLLHLLVNMYSLWMVGPYVEKLYGSAKFVVFWVVTGIAGVMASYLTVRPNLATGSISRFLFKALDEPSAGASGALFGLVGVLFVFGIKFRRELPEGFKRAFGTGMLPIIMINLFIGYIGRGFIDNAAHLGGLLSGAALAVAVQYRRPGERPSVATLWRVLQALAIGVVVFSFYKVARNFQHIPPPIPVQQISANSTQIFVNYVAWINQAQETTSKMIHDGDPGNAEVLAKTLKAIPAPDAEATELRDRLSEILGKMVSELKSSGKNAPRRPAPIPKEQIDEYSSWRKDYDQWLKGAAPKRQTKP
jgi:membrane associated rhomboid family serine protease